MTSFPLIPNGPYHTFPPSTRALGPGLHLVERLLDGRYVGIHKPGYKSEHDFVVALVDTDGLSRLHALSHVEMLDDFHGALSADRGLGLAFVDVAFEVFGGAEPPERMKAVGLVHEPDFVLKSLKWIWAQEDVNYPLPRYQGRTMSGKRLQEVVDGIDLNLVKARAATKGRPPSDLPGVDYERVRRALAG